MAHDAAPDYRQLPTLVDSQSQPLTAAEPEVLGRPRNRAIDALRGIVMVLMVLDHARDFYFGPMRVRATDLTVTTPLLFYTRFVTHFCAPVFVFLAGTSAFLYGARTSRSELSRFLVARGALLVLLELTVVRLCWIPDPFYRFTLLQVIWALGWSMILLAALVHLPGSVSLAVGVLIVAGHNLLDAFHARDFGALGWVWSLLLERGSWEPLPGHRVVISYPILPWFGVMVLGHAFGAIVRLKAAQRRARTLRLGLLACCAFAVLRAWNTYGDPVPWSLQPTAAFSVMSFLNCEKYPPSLCYLLMTLGPALCLLSLLESQRVQVKAYRGLVVRFATLGGVPLFFYIAHLVLLRYTSAPLAVVRFGASAFSPPPGHAGSPEFDLWVAYLAWIVALLALYPLAAWFRRKKEQRPNSWLRYS